MRRIVVVTNLTLDGVMQAPGRPDEDRRGGFEHGGWAAPFNAMLETGDSMANMDALLFGRWTYESFYSFWPGQAGSPFTEVLNNIPKYVASRTLEGPLLWSNSTLLKGEAAQTVAGLKEGPGHDVVIWGSGGLVRSLMRANLIDEYVLLFHPLVLGTGRRLFTDGGAFAALRLVDAKPTSKGVLVASYRPA
jgi:dihydrofolate reductase